MIKLSIRTYITLKIFIVSAFFMSTGCSVPGDEGFAIYLTKGDIPPTQMESLSHVDIAGQPVITTNDIISYDAQTHEISVTEDAFNRISKLEVPVRGRSFVACVNRSPVYWGAFWTPISSISFDGITIMKPLRSQEARVIRLEPGYPGPDFYRGEDPRNISVVMETLKQAGKLINIPPVTPSGSLPHSMKGYELYSWTSGGQWHFTLITGTNRNKTLDEITSGADAVMRDGWLNIRVTGVEALKAVLSRLPANEEIFWLSTLREEQAAQGDAEILLPVASVIDSIKTHAAKCGLNLSVLQP